MDGKTHGPSTMAVLLGSTNMAKRSGIIMDQNFEKMVESGEYADLRDAMANTMKKKFNTITQGVTYINHENQDIYRDILDAAINDRENFLKERHKFAVDNMKLPEWEPTPKGAETF